MTASGFYHCSVKSVGRGNGASLIQKAAYRAGVRLVDERTGEIADYRARVGVDDSFIIAREDAPAWAHDLGRLFNEAERAEARANGRLATEIVVALPHELDTQARRALAESFAGRIVERHGVAAHVAIHAPDKEGDHRNHHAHILITHRELGADGYGEIANRRTTTKKVKGQEKQIEIAGIAATPADIRDIRKDWEQRVNRAYERAGLDIRADHRSHEERGIAQEPTKHMGPTATAMERDGKASERGDANREITQRNAERRELAALEIEAGQLGAAIIDLQAERAMRDARAAAKGRTDDTRAGFAPAAARTTAPVAPNFDRDAADAAWLDQVAAAGIAKDRSAPSPQPAPRSAAPAAKETARETAREARQRSGRAAAPDTARREAQPSVAPARAPEKRGKSRVAGGLAAGVAKTIGALMDFVGNMFAPPPPPTKDQAERAQRVAVERQEARADAAAKEAHLQSLLDQMARDDAERRRRGRERGDDGERDRSMDRER